MTRHIVSADGGGLLIQTRYGPARCVLERERRAAIYIDGEAGIGGSLFYACRGGQWEFENVLLSAADDRRPTPEQYDWLFFEFMPWLRGHVFSPSVDA